MMKDKKRIGDILIENKLVDVNTIKKIIEKKFDGEKIGETAIRLGYITEGQFLDVLEEQTGSKRINLLQYPIKEDILKMIPEEYCIEKNIIAIDMQGKKIVVALSDPLDYFTLEDIRMVTGLTAKPVLATKQEIDAAIKKYYSFSKTLKNLGLENLKEEEKDEVEINSSFVEENETPIGKVVNQILSTAVASRASDIHIDPSATRVAIRYRVDGVMQTEQVLPKTVLNQLISRIKVMAKMRIQETRRPQDGRIKKIVDGKAIDLRISTLPTIDGEKVVMRLLDLNERVDGVDALGLNNPDKKKIRRLIHNPNGIVLVSGPTGSGKSTTLYSCLIELNSEDVNIITVEDPVEMQIEGINQVQVQSDIDLTFSNTLRSILRQDPNIIMVGEIRDSETSEISIRAALTGHLVLSTIHTNDAVRTITRLIDMGTEPFLVSSSLIGVISQRLVRKLCRSCSYSYTPTFSESELLSNYGFFNVKELKKTKGCPTCNNTGYQGRIGIFEILEINDNIRKLISSNSDFVTIKEQAIKDGMKPLISAGLEKVINGITSIEELMKTTID